MELFNNTNVDVRGHGPSIRVNMEQTDGRRLSERPGTRTNTDVRLLVETTTMSLTSMALMSKTSDDTKSFRGKVFHVYSSMILLVLLGFFAWDLSMNIDMYILASIQITIWKLQGIAHFAIFYAVSFRSNCMSNFFKTWQLYRNKYYIKPGAIKYKSNICALMILICTILSAAFHGYTTFMNMKPTETDIFYFTFSIISFVLGNYSIFAWIASSGFMMLLANLLAEEYRQIHKDMEEVSRQGQHLLNQRIGDIRRRHWELTQVVGKANDIFCAHLGLSFVASLVLSCVGLYIIIWVRTPQTSVTLEVIRVLKVLTALAKLTSDCMAGIILNNSVSISHATILHFVTSCYDILEFCIKLYRRKGIRNNKFGSFIQIQKDSH